MFFLSFQTEFLSLTLQEKSDSYSETKLNWTQSNDQNTSKDRDGGITNGLCGTEHTGLSPTHTIPTSRVKKWLLQIPSLFIVFPQTHFFFLSFYVSLLLLLLLCYDLLMSTSFFTLTHICIRGKVDDMTYYNESPNELAIKQSLISMHHEIQIRVDVHRNKKER